MSRGRNISPFPTAHKFLRELENELTPTVIAEPAEDLLEACTHRGKRCKNCRTWDEVALGWEQVITICEEDGYKKEEWLCKLCCSERAPLKYVYMANELIQSEERPFDSKRTKRVARKKLDKKFL